MEVREIQNANITSAEVAVAGSAVSWAAIIAGAATAVAVTLILLLLGSGLGMASVSPWVNSGISAATFSVAAAIWLIATQWIASGMSGYLTGRLRTKWAGVDPNEIYFRDTAHGFLAWAVATLITAGFLGSLASAIIGGGATAVTAVSAGAAAGASQAATENSDDRPGSINAYIVDTLFRTDPANASNRTGTSINVPPNTAVPPDMSQTPGQDQFPAPPSNRTPSTGTPSPSSGSNDARGETMRILINGITTGGVPETDKVYLAQLISSNTGISMEEATRRVNDAIGQIAAAETKLREAADAARETASTVSIFGFLSLLIGAFIASAAAALGGHHRDEY